MSNTPGTGGGGTGRLDGLLADAARRHPVRTAVVDGDTLLGYAQLDALVTETADALRQHGVTDGTRVGVRLHRGHQAIVAIYGALRAGAVVAPLDAGEPPARTARVLRSGGLTHLLAAPDTLTGARESVPDGWWPAELPHGLVCLSPSTAAPEQQSRTAPASGGYVLFTSGSTGWPKGVLLSHENVLHFARWAADEFALGPDDRIGAQAAFTFDLSTFDIFSTAAAAASVHLLPTAVRAFPRSVVGWLDSERITALYAVPTLYQMLLHRGNLAASPPGALRIAAYAGEPFPPAVLEEYLTVLPHTSFYNLYGPTETNVCTYERVPSGWRASEPSTIGAAIDGVTVDLFDEHGRRTDSEGEICVAGPVVMSGYLVDGRVHDPTTELRFADGPRRAYRTGDLARRTPDGKLRLLGRRDLQIKRAGHRIDLLDIESTLAELPGVESSCVVARTDPEAAAAQTGSVDAVRLIAHVTGSAGLDADTLVAALSERLPRFMLPDEVVVADSLPTTRHGKVDRKRLLVTAHPEVTE
ncbi:MULTISPECIES: amino acid adenylation domain-containing protein [unclassified Streptomyces]|uniref:amino acid adenylation domain-containing protein n=1 Tax=unclassified Streptomyces TaxID=2593676 RepID=UPI0011549837|nr:MULTISPECIES: amino acid adenylation domain-containing protein [unclassified Streptomyces]QKV99468.1 amino acid adenylation domain-containing protein [Streptomyces sp. NA02536]TQL23612.1 amino acid adenylation domain-containing protein [Streptomyces sp. SLBN-134]